MRNETGDLVCGKFNRVFVVDAPVNPLLVINFCQQVQDGPLNIRRGWDILDSLRVSPANLLIRNVENKGMIRPQPVVLKDDVPRDRSIPITGKDDRFYFIGKTHNRTAQYPL